MRTKVLWGLQLVGLPGASQRARLYLTIGVLVALFSGLTSADVVHHYRFENGSEFLSDSVGSADLSGDAMDVALPGSSGRGAEFPKGFQTTPYGINRRAADFFSARLSAPIDPLTDDLTVEAFVHFDTLFQPSASMIVADAVSGFNGQFAWVLQARTDGCCGGQPNEFSFLIGFGNNFAAANSGFVLATNTDYYVAASYSASTGDVEFYLKDLTNNGAIETSSAALPIVSLNSIGLLNIGAIPTSGTAVDGIVDEVRISDSILSESELLINDIDIDVDDDGVANDMDSCIFDANTDQRNTSGDNFGNRCDPDIAPAVNDCVVNFLDLNAVKIAFFSTPASPSWNPDADFDGSGTVNFVDLQIMGDFFFGPPGPSGLPNVCD